MIHEAEPMYSLLVHTTPLFELILLKVELLLSHRMFSSIVTKVLSQTPICFTHLASVIAVTAIH